MRDTHIKIGYFASLEQYTPADALLQAVLAENAGFDSLWVDDHFHPWYHDNAQSGHAWVWMGAALQATKNIPVSTGVTSPILRYHPAIVAQAFATLRQMYPGRVAIAVGAGEAMNEVPIVGTWPGVIERQDMTVEAVQVMRLLWGSTAPVTFSGSHFTLERAFLYTKPQTPVPIYFSGIGPRCAKLAGLHGDHLMTVASPSETIRKITIPTFEEGAREAGKDPQTMEHAMLIWYSVDPDYEKAVEGTRFWAAVLVPAMFRYRVLDPVEIQTHANLVSHEVMERNFVIATDAEGLIKGIERFQEAGINHFCLANSSPDVRRGIEIFREVLPQLRGM
jgi:secondary-alcohol dehydrogenase (coenzyme-F420)